MKAKDEAKELVERFLPHSKSTKHKEECDEWSERVTEAKQCALICVDKQLDLLESLEPSIGGRMDGRSRLSRKWLELKLLKQELERL